MGNSPKLLCQTKSHYLVFVGEMMLFTNFFFDFFQTKLDAVTIQHQMFFASWIPFSSQWASSEAVSTDEVLGIM